MSRIIWFLWVMLVVFVVIAATFIALGAGRLALTLNDVNRTPLELLFFVIGLITGLLATITVAALCAAKLIEIHEEEKVLQKIAYEYETTFGLSRLTVDPYLK